MLCSSIFTFSGNRPWCPRTLSFTLNLHLLSHQFLTCVFVLLVNPLLYIFTHSLGVRKSVFYHIITIFTKKWQFQSWGSHSSHSSEMSSLPSHNSRMLPQTWGKVWQINMSLGCSQYRCPSQGRMGRESSLLVPGLRESAVCIQDLFLINGQKSSGKAWDSPSSSFFQEAKLVPILSGFQWPIHNNVEQGRRGHQPKFSELYRPLSCRDQSSVCQLGGWALLLIFMEAASGHGYDTWSDGENGKACRRLCLLQRWHGWQNLLGIFFCPASNLRERTVMKKAMYAAKPWDSQKHYHADRSFHLLFQWSGWL